MIDKLKILGLNDSESKIYLAAYKHEFANVNRIALDSGIPRVTTYYILERLVKKGIVNERIYKGVKQYEAVDIKEVFIDFEQKFLDLKSVLPFFSELKTDMVNQPKINFYKGYEGFKLMKLDSLSAKECILGFVDPTIQITQFREYDEWDRNMYIKKRVKLGIDYKGIYLKNDAGYFSKLTSRDIKREVRFVPNNIFNFECEINIYNNKIAIHFFKDKNLYGVIIQDQNLTNTIKSIFNFIWGISKQYNQSIPKTFSSKNFKIRYQI